MAVKVVVRDADVDDEKRLRKAFLVAVPAALALNRVFETRLAHIDVLLARQQTRHENFIPTVIWH